MPLFGTNDAHCRKDRPVLQRAFRVAESAPCCEVRVVLQSTFLLQSTYLLQMTSLAATVDCGWVVSDSAASRPPGLERGRGLTALFEPERIEPECIPSLSLSEPLSYRSHVPLMPLLMPPLMPSLISPLTPLPCPSHTPFTPLSCPSHVPLMPLSCPLWCPCDAPSRAPPMPL